MFDFLLELLRGVVAQDGVVLQQHVELVGHHSFAWHFLHHVVPDAEKRAQSGAALQQVILEPGELLVHTVLVESLNLQEVSQVYFALVRRHQQQTPVLLKDGYLGYLLGDGLVGHPDVLHQVQLPQEPTLAMIYV